MYLINTTTRQLHRFNKNDEIPPYAILSHVWGAHEQTFADTPLAKSGGKKRDLRLRRSSKKIRGACATAALHGYKWLWADTSCIDASNSAELSEAINSMFELYRDASMCYAYLEDVPPGENPYLPRSAFRRSRWFKRVWTLQELIAPASVIFLASDWQTIGAKRQLGELIESITGIDRLVLTHRRSLEDVSIACRMSWAATREARREEDRAYSLMGIFGVYMPTIYGEKERAFLRLQEEIIKRSPDQSIFAWGRALHDYNSGVFVATAKQHDYNCQSDAEALFATSPADFIDCADITPIELSEFAASIGLDQENVPVYTHTSAGIRTTLPMVAIGQSSRSPDAWLGLLSCIDGHGRLICLFLRAHETISSKFLIGGYIAQGNRRNEYYRTSRLTQFERYLVASVSLKEVIIHSSRVTSRGRSQTSSSLTSSSASRGSLIFFEPPCTITISKSCIISLSRLGFVMPVIPESGFRLTAPGETRSISFIGYQSFTVHFGVCALEMSAGSLQQAQLWATVTFESGSDLDSLFATHSEAEYSLLEPEEPVDVHPDESLLVQHWKDHRQTFGTRSREVRLTFSYPCLTSHNVAERGAAEIYELEIRFHGYWGEERRRYKGSRASYSIAATSQRRANW
ncbi:heterokaryon incompatibility protein-domain-containing protein [Trametes maxima]|nr:heterokaryon incompatibility protein-domain-containing protein [Trametes maxima]